MSNVEETRRMFDVIVSEADRLRKAGVAELTVGDIHLKFSTEVIVSGPALGDNEEELAKKPGPLSGVDAVFDRLRRDDYRKAGE